MRDRSGSRCCPARERPVGTWRYRVGRRAWRRCRAGQSIRSVWFVETGERGPRFVATLAGETLAVVTVPANAVRPVGDKEIAHVPQLAGRSSCRRFEHLPGVRVPAALVTEDSLLLVGRSGTGNSLLFNTQSEALGLEQHNRRQICLQGPDSRLVTCRRARHDRPHDRGALSDDRLLPRRANAAGPCDHPRRLDPPGDRATGSRSGSNRRSRSQVGDDSGGGRQGITRRLVAGPADGS